MIDIHHRNKDSMNVVLEDRGLGPYRSVGEIVLIILILSQKDVPQYLSEIFPTVSLEVS